MIPWMLTLMWGCGGAEPEVVEVEPGVDFDVEIPAPKLEIPTTPGALTSGSIAEGGLRGPDAPEGTRADAAQPPPVEWNPISIPQGPREGGGVSWEGVKRKGGYAKPLGDGETLDPALFRK